MTTDKSVAKMMENVAVVIAHRHYVCFAISKRENIFEYWRRRGVDQLPPIGARGEFVADLWAAAQARIGRPPPPSPVDDVSRPPREGGEPFRRMSRPAPLPPATVLPPCVVCMTSPREYAPVPCGHLSLCHACVQLVSECPICRDQGAFTRIYLP